MLRPSNIVLPISGNRYVSISQNRKGNNEGIVYGNYAERVEIAILDSNFEIINDAFEDRDNINVNMRILFGTRTFDIISVEDDNEYHRYIKIIGREKVAT